MFLQTVLTALSFTALVAALPFSTDIVPSLQNLQARANPDVYKLYLGDGSTKEGWPSKAQWMSYDDMWNRNHPEMLKSCSKWQVANDSPEEISQIKSAIQTMSAQYKVDNRFVLAIIMQESGGCVRAPTSNFGVRNPGLMQDHDGQGTCNPVPNHPEKALNPCPQSQINQMIKDGTAGTLSGDGLQQILGRLGGNSAPAQSFYKAARIYNSGSVDPSGKLEKGVATHCYASDVANRLMGWASAPSNCHLDPQ